MRPVYTVKYTLYGQTREFVTVVASNKADAYFKAVYVVIPDVEGTLPYSAWVEGVTYNNGNYRTFNTHEGKPY